MEQSFMEKSKILPLIIKMSLPMVISMIVNALYNIVDTLFVAKLGEEALTALSIIFPIQNLSTAIGVGFGVGINALIAFYLGAKNKEAIDKCMTISLICSLIHGIIYTIITYFTITPFLKLFTDNEKIIEYGTIYFKCVVLFSPIVTFSVAIEKIFQAYGKMKTTMVAMALGCITNIILDPIFVFALDMGMFGAALATGIGQTISLLSYIVIILINRIPIFFSLKSKEKIFFRLYEIGIPATLNMGLSSFMLIALNSILASYSEIYVLVLGVYYKLQTFLYYMANGIIQGIRPIIGYNYGANKNDRVNETSKITLIIVFIIMVIGTILALSIPSNLISLFTENGETIILGAYALRIISIGFVFSSFSVTFSGVFEGLGKGFPSLIISLIRYVLIILIAFLLSLVLKEEGVWFSFFITEIIGCISSIVLYYFCYLKKIKKEC